MVDLSQFGTVAGLAVLVALIIQFLKGEIDVKFVPWVAVALGIVLANLIAIVLGKVAASSDVVSYTIGGFLAGLVAVGGYEASLDKLKGDKQ